MAQSPVHEAQTKNYTSLRVDLSTQACDICRQRKVKCLQSNPNAQPELPPRCQRCERLNLSCTFLSPSKARGPKKRENATATNIPAHPGYWTDDLCDRDLFEIIMSDYLHYIYPLVPVVHRPSFKKCLREDNQDAGFACLTVSIAALVVATMESRFQAYKMHDTPLRFATRKEMVHFCYQKVLSLRTASYYDELNFQKFATSFLFPIAFLQLGDHNWWRMLSVESIQLARLLKLHQISEYRGLNCIEVQLRKKSFWLLFYSYVHGTLQSLRGDVVSYLDPVFLHSINPEELMPLEVPDELIFENEVLLPEKPTLCIETGFILHSRVFWAAIRSPCPKAVEEPCSCVRAQNPHTQIKYFQERLQDLSGILDDIPDILRASSWTPEKADNLILDDHADVHQTELSFASIRVNTHVTHMWLQSLMMDQLEAAHSHLEAQGWSSDSIDQRKLWEYRDELCSRLFAIIYNSPAISLEANGLHLPNKVRDISTGLLACPFGVDDPISKRMEGYIRQSTEILSRLDRSECLNTLHFQSWVDTDRVAKN